MEQERINTLVTAITDAAHKYAAEDEDKRPTKKHWQEAVATVYVSQLPAGVTVPMLDSLKTHNEEMGSAFTRAVGPSVMAECKADNTMDFNNLTARTPLVNFTVGVVKKSKKDGQRKVFASVSAGVSLKEDSDFISAMWDQCKIDEEEMASFDDM